MRSEVSALLSLAGLHDQRAASPADVEKWFPYLEALAFEEAERAVRAHYADTGRPLMLGDLLRRIRDERARRVETEFVYIPGDPEESTDVYLARRRQQIANVAAGRPQVPGPRPQLAPRDVHALVSGISGNSLLPEALRERMALRRHPAMEVHCPSCRARPGQVCMRGENAPLKARMHPTRIDAWAIVAAPCPSCRAAVGDVCRELGEPYANLAHRDRIDAAGADLQDAS